VAGHDLGEGTRLAAATGAWIVFEDEAGQTLRPPKARTWACKGRTPTVRVNGKGSGRVSIAGLARVKPGQRGHVFYRLRIHRGRKNERRSLSEDDYATLITAAHHQLHAPIILIWDGVNVRHEASPIRAGMEGSRRRSVAADRVKLGAAEFRGRGMRWEAAPTTPGRAGTARRCGFGKRDEKLYARNQCLTPRNRPAGSNLADLGRDAVHATGCGGDSEAGLFMPVGRPR
jgi:putative transposase